MNAFTNQLNFLDAFDDIHNINMQNLIAKNPADPFTYFNAPDIDYSIYDYVVWTCSMGKDCLAVLCELLASGFPPSKIIALHHLVDGAESEEVFFDWHYINDYFQKFCARLGIQIAYAYPDGGLRAEILKNNTVSKDVVTIKPNGEITYHNRPKAKPNVRLKFPQLAASLSQRFCSSFAKIEPGEKFLRSMDSLFLGKKVAFLDGCRRQESPGRSRYNQLELHSVDTSRRSKNPRIDRHVDSVRPVLNFSEEQVWDSLKNFDYVAPSGERIQGILPPPAYSLFGRSSCAICIFNGDRAFSTLYKLDPVRIEKVSEYEIEFGCTIARPKKGQKGLTVLERALAAEPLDYTDEEAVAQCFRKEFTMPMFTSDGGRKWEIPFGAFSTESAGAL